MRSKYRIRLKVKNSIEPKLCPMCGGKAIIQIRSKTLTQFPYWVECIVCHLRTSGYKLVTLAFEAWNKRV